MNLFSVILLKIIEWVSFILNTNTIFSTKELLLNVVRGGTERNGIGKYVTYRLYDWKDCSQQSGHLKGQVLPY